MSHPHNHRTTSGHRPRHRRSTQPPQPPPPQYDAYASEGPGYDSGYAEATGAPGGGYYQQQDFSYYPFDDDPNCAVCDAPAKTRCSCEFNSLVVAVQQSEERVLRPLWEDIRRWVTYQSKAAIQRDFNARRSFRETAYNDYMAENSIYLSPEQSYELNRQLRKQIDQDWRDAVGRYPEVLDTYYALVMEAMRNGRGVEQLIYAQEPPVRTREKSMPSRRASATAEGKPEKTPYRPESRRRRSTKERRYE